jgi:hypothetical protein
VLTARTDSNVSPPRPNANLQAYYKRLGAQHVRTVEVPSRSSGALFEWAFRVPHIPADVTIDAPTHVLAEVRTTMHHPLDLANERSGEYVDPSPRHWHLASDLGAPDLGSPIATEPHPVWISGEDNAQGPFSITLEQAGWRTATGRTRRRARCSMS